jgi:electron transfer flavoprotein-quinone oxidoreductase
MQAQGPIIKGMNHAVTAGALAAEAFVEARSRNDLDAAGELYAEKLRQSGTMDKLRPRRYGLVGRLAEAGPVSAAVDAVAGSPLGRAAVRALPVERLFNSPFLLGMLPDTRTPYVTVPAAVAEATGGPIEGDNDAEPPSLGDRIGDLTYDTDVGNPHIELLDESWAASGAAVAACPVSARGFGGGCYREETVGTNGSQRRVVSLDTQPCVECGTCAIVADTDWEHPRGGKGVTFDRG